MSSPLAGTDTSISAYEELRTCVLAGSRSDSHSGLLLLLGQGVATWVARRAACSAPARPAATPGQSTPVLLATDELQASIVRVLASMALAGTEEMAT